MFRKLLSALLLLISVFVVVPHHHVDTADGVFLPEGQHSECSICVLNRTLHSGISQASKFTVLFVGASSAVISLALLHEERPQELLVSLRAPPVA